MSIPGRGFPMLPACAAVFFMFAATSRAEFDLKNWSWERPVDPRGATGFVRMPISPEVFDQSQPSLDDLRVLNSDGNPVPHIVYWGRLHEVVKREARPAKLINPTFEAGQFSRVTLDFSEPVEKNRVRVNLSGENYRRRALVEASTDTLSWERLAEDLWLFHVPAGDKPFRIDTLDLPANNFRYLRLTVFNMPDDPHRVTIEGADAELATRVTEKELAPVPVAVTANRIDEKARQSVLEFDLGHRNLPLAVLVFDFKDPFFHRGFQLFGRNSTRETVRIRTEGAWEERERETPWASITGGVFYRIREKDKAWENLKVESTSMPYRYLQVRVFNSDDPPLAFGKLAAQRRIAALIFQTWSGVQGYRLVGGNPGAGPANYDLARSMRGIEDETLPEAQLGLGSLLKKTPELLPWTERNATVIWGALALVVVAMVFLVIRGMRQLPRDDSGAQG